MQQIYVVVMALLMSLANSVAGQVSLTEMARLEKGLRSALGPELPAQAAQAVRNAIPEHREAVAQAVVRIVAEEKPASLVPVLASVSSAAPSAAVSAAALAAKASPGQASKLASAAAYAAPAYAAAIVDAVATQAPGVALPTVTKLSGNSLSAGQGAKNSNDDFKGNPPQKDPPPNRPETNPGNGEGNRPDVPPGHIRDPKPGRDDQKHYGSP
ncbi:MAG: hypothetical protein AB9869_20925 [Verrucomicrobiia bacterium]